MLTAPRSTSIAVVDYGVNNVGSVVNMLRRVDVEPIIARDANALEKASAIILPGIGAFDAGVTNLTRTGLFDAVRKHVLKGAPILGICLGMQLLTRGSEEGSLQGLGLIPATTRRFAFENGARRLKVPHMGWNETECVDRDLFDGFGQERPRFYYVHSFHVVCDDEANVAARATYGASFTAAVRAGHIFGTQFHPEKSHRFGMRVLANFAQLARHA